MRITRSTLRRLIAEESARLLREAAFPEEIEGIYGRGREGEEEVEEERGSRMLHVTYHGGAYEGGEGFSNVHYILTDFQANPMGEEAEDVTAEITGGEDLDALEDAYALKAWLESHREVGYVVNEEMHDPETDESSTADEYLEHLDGVIAAEEEEAGTRGGEMYGRAVDRGEYGDLDEGEKEMDLDEADAAPSPLAAAEGRLRAAIKDIHPTKAGSILKRMLDLIDDVMMEEAIAAVADGSRSFPTDASVRVLEEMGDTFPEDADFDELHAAIDAVIKPQWRGALESAEDDEGHQRDIADTERDLSHPSRFLEEGEGVSPRARLKEYLKSKHANASAVMKAIDDVLEYHNANYEEEDLDSPTSEDVTFRLSDAVLAKIPQKDSDLWHSMIDDVLNDEFSAADAAYDAAYRKDIEDTERDLSHPSNFLQEGDDDIQGDEDEDYGDTDFAAAEVRAGRHAEGPYGGLDSDTPAWHRQNKRHGTLPPRAFSDDTSGRGMYFRHSGEDVSMGYSDEDSDGDNLSESRWAKIAGILKG